MNFKRRRDCRGAFRATPEDIFQEAIARHRALRDQEEWRAKAVAPAPARPAAQKTAAARKTGDEIRRAQFAEGLARAAFGRFYRKAPPR
jgi:hypothetical protein